MPHSRSDSADFLSDGGITAEQLREHDWSRTPLGLPARWPAGLLSATRLLAALEQPALVVWGSEQTCLCNEACRKALDDIAWDGVLGQPASAVVPETWSKLEASFVDALAGRRTAMQGVRAVASMLCGGPNPVRWSCTLSLIEEERPEPGIGGAIVLLGRDPTVDERVEAALQASDQRLRIACEAAALGIYDLDLQTHTLHWDARMQALWASEQVGSVPHTQMMEKVHPDDRQAKRDAYERAADPDGDGHFQCEYRVVDAAAGVTRWIHAHGQVLFDGGQPQRLIGTVQDISERKQADARRDEFLATLGHELRNPLAPIGNALKVLQRGVDATGSAGHALAVVDRQFHHVVRLLDDLLDAVRLQHGRFALRKSRVTLADVLEQARETASARLEAGGNRLEQRLPREPFWLDADAVRLAQVVSNLLINASKYSEPGSVIELVAERRGDTTLCLAVHDHGIGIEPAFLERVFETFSQSQLALERTQGGLGIGLALARGIVGLHGGRITAHSAGPGHGSQFVLELPLAPQRSDGLRREERRVDPPSRTAAETAGDASADMRLAGRRILLVEDNHDHAETLSVLLGLYGARVRWAPDGLSALEAAREHQPDTILLDLGLPGLNGYEVCRRLRAQPWAKSVHIFALTGWGQPADRQRTREAGFDQHLLKPVDFDALLSLLSH